MNCNMIITLFLLLLLPTANAQILVGVDSEGLKLSGAGTTILYINGQGNKEKDAQETKELLLSQIKTHNLSSTIDINANVLLDKVYNETFGVNEDGKEILDFLESAVLILLDTAEDMSVDQAWSVVYQTVIQTTTPGSTYIDGMFTTLKPDTQEYVKFLSVEGITKLRQSTTDINNLLQTKILTALNADRNLVLLSHSQGNLFVNLALQQLKSESNLVYLKNGEQFNHNLYRVGHFQVASPVLGQLDMFETYFEVENNDYLTNSMDAILKIPFNLPDNIDLALPPSPDPRGELERENNHGMIATYLNGLEYGEDDLNNLRNAFYQGLSDVSSQVGYDTDDCNNDGILGDRAVKTRSGGYISVDSIVGDGVIVNNGARICNKSVITGEVVQISHDVVVSNTEIGNGCSAILILGLSKTLISDSLLCTEEGSLAVSNLQIVDSSIKKSQIDPLQENESYFEISNSNIIDSKFEDADGQINDSTFSNLFSFSGRANIYSSSFNGGSFHSIKEFIPESHSSSIRSIANYSNSTNTNVSGLVFLAGDTKDSTISGGEIFEDAFGFYVILNVREVTNSTVSGIGFLEGKIINSTVKAVTTSRDRISQLSPSASILNTTVSGSFWIGFDQVVSSPLIGNFCYYGANEIYSYESNGDCTLIEN